MKESIIAKKSFEFAIKIVNLYKCLIKEKKICIGETAIKKRNINWSKYGRSIGRTIKKRFLYKNMYSIR